MLARLFLPLKPLLEHLSRVLRIDAKYLAQGAFWGVLGQGVSAGSAFILSVLFAHFLSKETVGVYRYVLSIANLLTAFSLSGLNTGIIQSVARGYEGSFQHSFRRSLLWSLPSTLIGIGIGIYYFSQGNLAFALGIPLANALVNLWNAWLLFRSFLTGKRALQTLFFANTFLALIPLIVISGGLVVTQDPIGLLLLFLSSCCVVSAIIHAVVSKRFLQNENEDTEHERYSQHLSLLYILDTFASQLDKVLVFQTIGSASLATYTYATALPEQLRALVKNVQTAILPKFSLRPTKQILAELNHKILLSTLGLAALAGVYILLAKPFFLLFFPRYQEAIFPSQLFALILVFENGLAAVVFKAKRALKEQYITNIAGNLFKIFLMVAFLHWYGIVGLIVARVLARAFSFLSSFILIKRFRYEEPVS